MQPLNTQPNRNLFDQFAALNSPPRFQKKRASGPLFQLSPAALPSLSPKQFPSLNFNRRPGDDDVSPFTAISTKAPSKVNRLLLSAFDKSDSEENGAGAGAGAGTGVGAGLGADIFSTPFLPKPSDFDSDDEGASLGLSPKQTSGKKRKAPDTESGLIASPTRKRKGVETEDTDIQSEEDLRAHCENHCALGTAKKFEFWKHVDNIAFLTFNRSVYKMRQIGAGQFHEVYKFEENGQITIDGKILNKEKIVLKQVNMHYTNPKRRVVKDSLNAVTELRALNILMPEFHVLPTEKDPVWVVEYMPVRAESIATWNEHTPLSQLSDPQRQLIAYMKTQLNLTGVVPVESGAGAGAADQLPNIKLAISDFKLANIMQSEDGQFKFTDPFRPSNLKKQGGYYSLYSSLFDCSKANPHIFNVLVEDFHPALKANMLAKLKNGETPNKTGCFSS